jgi:hypothetical protein
VTGRVRVVGPRAHPRSISQALEKFEAADLPPFPERTWFADLFRSEPDPEVVNERSRALETYFTSLLTHTKYLPLRKALSAFLAANQRDNVSVILPACPR